MHNQAVEHWGPASAAKLEGAPPAVDLPFGATSGQCRRKSKRHQVNIMRVSEEHTEPVWSNVHLTLRPPAGQFEVFSRTSV